MKTKFYLPQNFFSKLFLTELNPADDLEIISLPASLISKKVSEDNNSIGLIPSMDLLTFKEFFVSSRIGISFNALLSNAYVYYKEDQESIEELAIAGEVTSNEIVISKILFKEFYDLDIKPKLLTQESIFEEDNLILTGDKNFQEELFLNGLSFSEEVIELIDAPYINFLTASSSDAVLKSFVNNYEDSFINGHEEVLKNMKTGFPELANDFIKVNIQHIVFDFENQDLEGINKLLQMPYYYGITKELIDIKFL
ncbi:MAG: hypothetical protein KGZ85_16120 [Ignavibacterium sp.]|nr:hypothetical protein [Ignavibacterium sp.]